MSEQKEPGWKKWIAPAIIVPVIVTLMCLGYNSVAEDVDKNQDQIQDLQKEKVDNDTLKLMIDMMQKQNEVQMVQMQRQSEQVDEALEEIKDMKQKDSQP